MYIVVTLFLIFWLRSIIALYRSMVGLRNINILLSGSVLFVAPFGQTTASTFKLNNNSLPSQSCNNVFIIRFRVMIFHIQFGIVY